MKYQAYPEYMDSGIECLGKLPKHWVVQSLSIATKRISVGLATSVTDYYRDEGVPIIRNMNIKEGFFDGSDMLYLDEKFASSQATKVVYGGDVIAVHTGSNIGLACIVPEKYDQCHTFTTLIVTTNDGLLNRYLTYCINSAYGKAEVNRLKFGFGKDNLNVKEFRCFYTLLPKYQEQVSIANFLDHETAKIDTLIEQQQLIKLLKEKRQAVISHAVTKGLNPNVPMRDSGVEWLGEVLKQWVITKVKFFAKMQGGYAFNSDDFKDDGIQILRIGNVYLNRLELERQPVFVDDCFVKSHEAFVVRFGDLLMSLTGTLGKTDYGYAVRVDIEEEFMLNQRVAKITPNKSKITND
jgi:type I restriction enzyme, S subunit